jgi:hypothetical protein
MNNSNVKINEILLSMISHESLENIKKYYLLNKKHIDIQHYKNNKIIDDCILYERIDIIEWLSSFIKLDELSNYTNCIYQCVFMNNIDILRWFYNYSRVFFSNITNNKDNLSKYDKIIKQCIATDNIELIRWFEEFTSVDFMSFISNNENIFLSICAHNAIKCWDFLKKMFDQYGVEIKENIIVDKWKNTHVLFYIFFETARSIENYSCTGLTSSDTWSSRQKIKIENTNDLIEKINSMSDDQFKRSTCGMFEHTVTDLTKRNSTQCEEKIEVKISNFDSVVKENYSKSKDEDTDEDTKIFPFQNSDFILLNNYFSVIKYEIGEKFDWHFDSKQNEYHTHTLLLFPPQKIKGGELYVKHGYLDSRNDRQICTVIKPHEHIWTLVLIPIGMFHMSSPVSAGRKITLKGTGYISNINRIKVIVPEVKYPLTSTFTYSHGLADSSYSYNRCINNTFYDEEDLVVNASFEEDLVVNASFEEEDW